jgi:hypothetical protein
VQAHLKVHKIEDFFDSLRLLPHFSKWLYTIEKIPQLLFIPHTIRLTIQSPNLKTFKEPKNLFPGIDSNRQAGNRFLTSLKGLQIRAQYARSNPTGPGGRGGGGGCANLRYALPLYKYSTEMEFLNSIFSQGFWA